jgi:hypothetical protein
MTRWNNDKNPCRQQLYPNGSHPRAAAKDRFETVPENKSQRGMPLEQTIEIDVTAVTSPTARAPRIAVGRNK